MAVRRAGLVAQARERPPAALRDLGLIECDELGLDVLVLADHGFEPALVILEQPSRPGLAGAECVAPLLQHGALAVAPGSDGFEAGDERGWNRCGTMDSAPVSSHPPIARVYRARRRLPAAAWIARPAVASVFLDHDLTDELNVVSCTSWPIVRSYAIVSGRHALDFNTFGFHPCGCGAATACGIHPEVDDVENDLQHAADDQLTAAGAHGDPRAPIGRGGGPRATCC